MNFKEYIKQLSIVILGIIIAFWINNLGMHYEERSQQEQILQIILNEQIENSGEVESVIRNLDTLYYQFNNFGMNTNGTAKITYSGISQNSIGFETTKYTGDINNLNYSLLSKIVKNYEILNSLIDEERIMSEEIHSLFRKDKIADFDPGYLLHLIENFRRNLSDYNEDQVKLIQELKKELKEK